MREQRSQRERWGWKEVLFEMGEIRASLNANACDPMGGGEFMMWERTEVNAGAMCSKGQKGMGSRTQVGGTGFRLKADPERQEGQGAQGHKGRRVGPCGGLGAERSNGVF